MSETSAQECFVEESLSNLRELVDQNLGGGFDPDRRARLEDIIARMAREQYDLFGAIEHGHMSPEDYYERFTKLIGRAFEEIDQVLGRAGFERVFGGPPETARALIDPWTFAHAHGQKTPPRPE